MNAPAQRFVALRNGDDLHQLTLSAMVHSGSASFMVEELQREVSLNTDQTAVVQGRRLGAQTVITDTEVVVFTAEGRYAFERFDPLAELAHEEEAGTMTAPMNGTIVAVNVAAGDAVKEGQALVVMEAMKMEYTIRAPFDGTVDQVFFQAGELVSDGAELVSLSEHDA